MIETMADTFDGLAIARQRIAEEAEARTGFLDLGGLGLTALPPDRGGTDEYRRKQVSCGGGH